MALEKGECRQCHHIGMMRRVIYVCPACGWINSYIPVEIRNKENDPVKVE